MTDIVNNVGYTYIDYSAAFHMKYTHLFIGKIYDHENVDECPLIITWAETDMEVDKDSGKCLAIATKVNYYSDKFKISEDIFENMLQAFLLFPDTKDDDEDSSKLRLEFVKALLNK